MAFEEDFTAHLRARAGITALTRHKIYPQGEVPQGTRGSYIVYSIDANTVNCNSGYGGITEADVTLHCYGDGFKAARDLYAAVFTSINGYTGTMGATTSVSGCTVTDYSDIHERAMSGQDTGTYRRSMSVTIWHKETAPTLT